MGKRPSINQATERADPRPNGHELILLRRAHRRHARQHRLGLRQQTGEMRLQRSFGFRGGLSKPGCRLNQSVIISRYSLRLVRRSDALLKISRSTLNNLHIPGGFIVNRGSKERPLLGKILRRKQNVPRAERSRLRKKDARRHGQHSDHYATQKS